MECNINVKRSFPENGIFGGKALCLERLGVDEWKYFIKVPEEMVKRYLHRRQY